VAEFDAHTPAIARVYDYLLNGKDNYAVDREAAERLMAVQPLVAEMVRANRQFLANAVTWTANQGISQYIDLGCGMPTVPNTHETARAVTADARVAYIDNDPVVVGHLRALTAKGDPGLTVIDGDVREADKLLATLASDVDLSAPACLMLGWLLHFFAPDAARDLVAQYVAVLAPGSYVVLSAGRGDGDAADEATDTYSEGVAQIYNHSVADFTSFFGPLELVPPGVVDAREWRPDWEPVHLRPRKGQTIAGVARVPLAD
jgi:O-methyltransferase involved in polyketide biosynthesis